MLVTERKISAIETEDGAGARIKRLFPTLQMPDFDPFVLLDEFFLAPSAGFPLHPHRGFEAVTFMLEGGFHHTDTMGNDRTIFTGGVQYFVAGRGIEHAEMPGTEMMNHGIQLWVNLPQRLKKLAPSYHEVPPERVPIDRNDDMAERLIVGGASPVHLHTAADYRHVVLMMGGTYLFRVPEGMKGLIYLIQGNVMIEDESLNAGEALIFEQTDVVEISAGLNSQFMILAGVPHREPIHMHGSFVD
jgi:redox-sensitive bicupin YhaK (pirin superfamily)